MSENNKLYQGYNAQKYVSDYFKSNGFTVSTIDSFYDLLITKNGISKEIEVKSCHPVVNRSSSNKRPVHSWGRFIFGNSVNTKLQKRRNVIICFVMCIGDNCEILGFVGSRALNVKGKYYTLKDLFSRPVYHTQSFLRRFEK